MKLPPSEEDLKQQAEDFGEVTTICKSNDKCVGMTIWGVGYKDSWIPQEFPGMSEFFENILLCNRALKDLL